MVNWEDSLVQTGPLGLGDDRKGTPANGGRRFAHPELTDFPATSPGRGKIANKTHLGNILTRRAVVTARRITRPEIACGRLGAGRTLRPCSRCFQAMLGFGLPMYGSVRLRLPRRIRAWDGS